MNKKNFYFSLIATLFSFGLIVISFYNPFVKNSFQQAMAQSSGSTVTLNNFAWSSNTGWILMHGNVGGNGSEYGVTVNGSTVSGYGWSPNVGWLSFNAADTSVCGSAASYNNGVFSGYAIFTSGKNRTDGWNGCVKLSGTATSGTSYGVKFSTTDPTKLTGYAWGSEVVGWIDFSGVTKGGGGGEFCPDGSVAVNGICPNTCQPGTTTCGGTMCPASGKCAVLCPDGSAMPATGLCAVTQDLALAVNASCLTTGFSLTSPKNNGFAYTIKDTSNSATLCRDSIVQGAAGCSVSNTTLTPGPHTFRATITNGGTGAADSKSFDQTATVLSPNSPSCQTSDPTVISSFTASPALVQKGGMCTLNWTSSSASGDMSCSIRGSDNSTYSSLSGAGSKQILDLEETIRYTLTCTNGTTQATKQATCNVGNYHEF